MDVEFWKSRWDAGQIGFHQDSVNPYLQRHWGRTAAAAGGRVLVPLCGKSRDLMWLAEQGHKVTGVEVVPMAVEAFFAEQGVTPRRYVQGAFEAFEYGRITILCGDFFALRFADTGPFGAVYDRASLIALPPALRVAYAAHLLSLLDTRGRVLLVTMDYPQAQMDGPPFGVTQDEVDALYGAACDVSLLETADVLADNPRFQERGLTRLEEKTYLLARKVPSTAI